MDKLPLGSKLYSSFIKIEKEEELITLKSENEKLVSGLSFVSANKLKVIKRSGILPFYQKNEKIFFLFGVDGKYNELTDFGGMIYWPPIFTSKEEEELDGEEKFFHETLMSKSRLYIICLSAIKELYEETAGIFDFRESKEMLYHLMQCPVIIWKDICIILLKIDEDKINESLLREKFLENLKKLKEGCVNENLFQIKEIENITKKEKDTPDKYILKKFSCVSGREKEGKNNLKYINYMFFNRKITNIYLFYNPDSRFFTKCGSIIFSKNYPSYEEKSKIKMQIEFFCSRINNSIGMWENNSFYEQIFFMSREKKIKNLKYFEVENKDLFFASLEDVTKGSLPMKIYKKVDKCIKIKYASIDYLEKSFLEQTIVSELLKIEN